MAVLQKNSGYLTMYRYTRTKTIGVENREDEKFVIHGFLQDHVYTIELDLEVERTAFTILSAIGQMKRYATPDCPRAPGILMDAVGLKIGEPDFEASVKRLVGRYACRHLADLFVECCRSIYPAAMQSAWKDAHARGESRDVFVDKYLNETDWIKDSCRTFSQGK